MLANLISNWERETRLSRMQNDEEVPVLESAEYQSMADSIRSGQVPDSDVIAIMRKNPAFARWYRDRYRLDDRPS